MLRLLLPIAVGLLLSGCATRYQSAGLTGGHIQTKGPGALELITFAGNGYTSSELTQKYATYRCAELAEAGKKPFFIMYDSLLAAADERPTRVPRVGQVQGKPIATVFLLLLDRPRPGSQETSATLAELRPVVEAGAVEPSK